MELKYLEFNKLVVVDTDDGSEQYLNKEIIGTKIEIGTTIIVGNIDFNLDYIIESDQNRYRLINSNATLIVKKK